MAQKMRKIFANAIKCSHIFLNNEQPSLPKLFQSSAVNGQIYLVKKNGGLDDGQLYVMKIQDATEATILESNVNIRQDKLYTCANAT